MKKHNFKPFKYGEEVTCLRLTVKDSGPEIEELKGHVLEEYEDDDPGATLAVTDERGYHQHFESVGPGVLQFPEDEFKENYDVSIAYSHNERQYALDLLLPEVNETCDYFEALKQQLYKLKGEAEQPVRKEIAKLLSDTVGITSAIPPITPVVIKVSATSLARHEASGEFVEVVCEELKAGGLETLADTFKVATNCLTSIYATIIVASSYVRVIID